MKRRTGEFQVFSMSFLDVLSCALGGTLLLLLLVQDNAQSEAQQHEETVRQKIEQITQAERDLKAAQEAIEQARKDAEKAKRSVVSLANANKKLKQAQASLSGLAGNLDNVVFVFDTSGSMADNYGNRAAKEAKGPRFKSYLTRLEALVRNYPFEQFNVLRFSSDVTSFRDSLSANNKANQDAAANFIQDFTPKGGTSTLAALKKAFENRGVDTVVLFSDGSPSDAKPDAVKAWVEANHRGIVVNCVAIGNNRQLIQFLKEVAQITGGRFQGI